MSLLAPALCLLPVLSCGGLGSEVIYTEPALLSIEPEIIELESTGVELALRGENFTQQSRGTWNSEDRPTRFISAKEVRMSLRDLDLAAPGSGIVTITTPNEDGSLHVSNSRMVTITLGTPVLESISPTVLQRVIGDKIIVTVNGRGFNSYSRVGIKPTNCRAITYGAASVTSTQITFEVEPAAVCAGLASAWVENVVGPQKLPSDSVPLAVVNPSAVIDSVEMTVVDNYHARFRVFGHNLTEESTVQWAGQDVPSSYRSAPTPWMSFELDPVLPDDSRNSYVTVVNPPPGGGASTPFPVDIGWGTPTPRNISPTSVQAAYPAETVFTIYGDHFTPNSLGLWNNRPRLTEFISPGEVLMTVPEADKATVGIAQIRITDVVVGDTSAPFQVTVFRGTPTVIRTRPDSVLAGYPSRTIFRVYGSNYTPNSVGLWNDQPRNTEFRTTSELWIEVTTEDKAVAGTGYMRVFNPSSGDTSVAYPVRLYP